MSRRFQGSVLGAGFNPLQAPNAPTIDTASGESGAVSVAFTAPSNVGGSNVSSYAVRVSPGDFSASGVSSPITVTGLTNRTAYTFSVAAINSYGFSPYSGTATATAGLFVEDVFSTYLYTGNGSTQTITNGIDLAGKGGLVWVKSRSAATNNFLFDTTRGANVEINSNTTDANATLTSSVTAFNSTGFALGSAAGINVNATTYASWTFRKAPKFFDVVTYTGDGLTHSIAHNLGVAPGCIIVKRTDTASNWAVYHRGQSSSSYYTKLNLTDAQASDITVWSPFSPTSSIFYVGTSALTNASGGTYVAYLFAHDPTADGIIQCGSYTGNGSATGPVINLGWEPQWLMIKNTSGTGNWQIIDNMRGMPVGMAEVTLQANLSNAESVAEYVSPTATGFQVTSTSSEVNTISNNYIYIAIRGGLARTPTVGTSVFMPVAQTGNGTVTTNFPVDLVVSTVQNAASNKGWFDRLRGSFFIASPYVLSSSSVAEANGGAFTGPQLDNNTGYRDPTYGGGVPVICWNFRRAFGFFDIVAYTGTGAIRTVNHNLGVTPELIIIKNRTSTASWSVYVQPLTATRTLTLNNAGGAITSTTIWNNTEPTSTVFTVGTSSTVNTSGSNYVAYLFASCPGVSKVGTYTGNGTSQTIDCGFSNGARFFLVKRTNTTGSWWVWDSARGIVAAAESAIQLNSTAAEVTTADAVNVDNTGIIVNQEATCNINVSGSTYIFLAIA